MAKKKANKTGRGRKSRIDMSTEAGRLLLHDMINYKKSGYNPFIPDSIKSEEFWKSRVQFEAGS
jgi:hypothetical protein